MKQTLLTALLCWLVAISAWAQNSFSGTIKGAVTDSTNKAPLGYVTVLIQETGKDQPLKSTFTKDDGSFEVTGLPDKAFQVTLTYVGYKNQTIKAPAFGTNTTIDLGKVMLVSTANKLKEVEIVTEKLLVTQDVDKLSYNVDADPESKTMNALDMLRKVPLLTVDAEDNIKLNGSGNYRVLINGKTSSLFANNPKDVFKSMPANSIKNVEVITNPPSKYEAEGVGGIINIITHKKNPGGYNGSVNFGGGLPGSAHGGGYFTVKTGKFGMSGYGGLSRFNNPANRNTLYRETKAGDILNQQGTSRYEGNYGYFSGELSFELDTLNLFTANYSFNLGYNDNYLNQIATNYNAADNFSQAFIRRNTGENQWLGSDIGADYQRTFKRSKDQLLTLSYKFNNYGNQSISDFIYAPADQPNSAPQNKTENNGSSKEHTFQVDYVHPIGKHSVELGAKTITRINNSDYYYKTYNEETGSYTINPALTNEFDYLQDIYAAYTAVTLKKGNWGLKIGSRLEETRVDADFKSTDTGVKQDYFNLIPNISVSKKLKGTSTVRLSYTQRIERPSLWYLNPYRNEIDPRNISYGNPELDAATNNVFNIAYNTFFKGTSINASLFHNFTDNSIQRFTVVNDGISTTTYGNIGRNQTYGMSLSGNTTLFKKLSINLNGTTNYVRLNSYINGQPQDNDGFTFNVYSYASYRFNKGWRVSGNVGLNSPSVLLQGKSSGYMFNSLSVNKQFLKDNKASINLSISSPFQKNRRWFDEIQDNSFYQSQESYFLMRRVNMSFNYRFGKLDTQIAKKKRGINNDDIKSGGNNTGGSGGNGN